MTPTRATLATLCAAVLSAASAVVMLVPAPVHYGPDHADCAPLVLAEDTDYSHLIDAGYFGTPSDGMEALYAPECRNR